jgi:hypothetical protein
MMKAELAYRLHSKVCNRWWLRLCLRLRQAWLYRLLAPKAYRISGCYGEYHFVDGESAKSKP